ncbi:Diphthamide synthesis DHP2 eukaryotic [Penicillium cf. griseofulvum]|nr:Diphthamide synthesis DHP2 eukaryotic [Penicillium cf. griseofulvum]
MGSEMKSAPVLSTADDRILEETNPVAVRDPTAPVSDDELSITYDIERTLKEIRQARYKRIALQFPDDMLPDAPRVFQLLSRGLEREEVDTNGTQSSNQTDADLIHSISELRVEDKTEKCSPRFTILADTSYGTCCVDEVAAEHVDADVVVHYGRSCLSPTARLPVIYVFTHKNLPLEPVVRAFKATYPEPTTKVVIAADVTYADHVPTVYARLLEEGYSNLYATEVVHEPSSPIPNRTVPESVREAPETLANWQLFHISDPPTALMMTLASRVAAIHIYPTNDLSNENVKPLPASTAAVLRRRYGTLASLTTVPIWGILINTLSKKSYMFVVGKLNAAKVANFSEIGGWVVIGCWESSLVDSTDFWKPVITPFELELALKDDSDRVWTGAWQSDFQAVLDAPAQEVNGNGDGQGTSDRATMSDEDDMSEPESAPPEFDLRTGRYVSNSRPMREPAPRASQVDGSSTTGPSAARALARRAKGDLAMIGGAVSPGAEYLRSQRTWTGLGSDFNIRYDEEDSEDSTLVKEGRKGIARGYTVGDATDKH